jgi:hypothetical protein
MNNVSTENRHQRTSRLAYQLWEKRGRPLGTPEIDWTAAEKAIDSEPSLLAEQLPLYALRWEADERPRG